MPSKTHEQNNETKKTGDKKHKTDHAQERQSGQHNDRKQTGEQRPADKRGKQPATK